MTEIETADIFRGAYLLCCGAQLSSTRMEANHQMVFVFSGNRLDEKDLSYRKGEALVNPLHLRETLNLLRDFIFERKAEVRRQESKDKLWTLNAAQTNNDLNISSKPAR